MKIMVSEDYIWQTNIKQSLVRKMKMRYKMVIPLAIYATLMSVVVYAVTTWEVTMQGNVNVVTAGKLAVYWDEACTQVVGVIDFGDLARGYSASKTLYIKNEATETRVLDWSGLGLAGDVLDAWDYYTGTSWADIKGYSLGAGEVLETSYQIAVLGSAALGPVEWTLQLGYQ